MTVSDVWKKYTHCPHCIWYSRQGRGCDCCKWYIPIRMDEKIDNFQPTDDFARILAKYENGGDADADS